MSRTPVSCSSCSGKRGDRDRHVLQRLLALLRGDRQVGQRGWLPLPLQSLPAAGARVPARCERRHRHRQQRREYGERQADFVCGFARTMVVPSPESIGMRALRTVGLAWRDEPRPTRAGPVRRTRSPRTSGTCTACDTARCTYIRIPPASTAWRHVVRAAAPDGSRLTSFPRPPPVRPSTDSTSTIHESSRPAARAHPPDEAVLRRQGGASGRAAVLPHGRLLRAVLRRRAQGRAAARHHPDPARRLRRASRSRWPACRIMPPKATWRGWWRWANRWRSASRSAIPALAKGLVERKVVRIVTPGTVTDEALLNERRDTLLLAVARGKQRLRPGLGRPRRRPLPGQRSRQRRRAGSRTRAPGTGRSCWCADEEGWPAFVADAQRPAPARAVAVRCRQRPPPAAAVLRPARPRRLRHRRQAAGDRRRRAPCSAMSRKRRSSACRT